MKLTRTLILTALLLMVVFVPAAQAATAPVGTCPPGFVLHDYDDMMMDHDHHIGITTDINGNGKICVKHLANGLHVHVDDVVR